MRGGRRQFQNTKYGVWEERISGEKQTECGEALSVYLQVSCLVLSPIILFSPPKPIHPSPLHCTGYNLAQQDHKEKKKAETSELRGHLLRVIQLQKTLFPIEDFH